MDGLLSSRGFKGREGGEKREKNICNKILALSLRLSETSKSMPILVVPAHARIGFRRRPTSMDHEHEHVTRHYSSEQRVGW